MRSALLLAFLLMIQQQEKTVNASPIQLSGLEDYAEGNFALKVFIVFFFRAWEVYYCRNEAITVPSAC